MIGIGGSPWIVRPLCYRRHARTDLRGRARGLHGRPCLRRGRRRSRARTRGGAQVFQVGTPVLVGLDELEGDDQVMVMTGVGAPGHAAAARVAARRPARARARLRGLGGARRDRRHDDGAPGRVHGRHVARQCARPAPRRDRLQRQRPRPSDRRDGRHGSRRPHRHQRRAGRRRRRRGSPNGHVEIVARGPIGVVSTCCTTPPPRRAACCSRRAGPSPSTSCASTVPSAPSRPASASARRCSRPRAKAARR